VSWGSRTDAVTERSRCLDEIYVEDVATVDKETTTVMRAGQSASQPTSANICLTGKPYDQAGRVMVRWVGDVVAW
jgi:hypothetical protein